MLAWEALLDEVYEKCQAQVHEEPENERFIGWEALYSVLIYEAIKLFLPEIKAWLKLPAMQLALFRQNLEKKLKEYALEKGHCSFPIRLMRLFSGWTLLGQRYVVL